MQFRMFCTACVLMCLATFAITPALADTVSYSTTGVFTSSGTNVMSGANGLTITYSGASGDISPVPPPSVASFGTFKTTGPTSGTDSVSDHFSLTITQTIPSSGNETLTDTFSGTITASSSQVYLTFTGGGPEAPVLTTDPITGIAAYRFTLGPAIYWVDQKTAIVSAGNGGTSTIQGAVSSIPDGGATLMLLGSALFGLETLRRKFRV